MESAQGWTGGGLIGAGVTWWVWLTWPVLFGFPVQKSVALTGWMSLLKTAQLGKEVWTLENFLCWALSTFFFFKNKSLTALLRSNL